MKSLSSKIDLSFSVMIKEFWNNDLVFKDISRTLWSLSYLSFKGNISSDMIRFDL